MDGDPELGLSTNPGAARGAGESREACRGNGPYDKRQAGGGVRADRPCRPDRLTLRGQDEPFVVHALHPRGAPPSNTYAFLAAHLTPTEQRSAWFALWFWRWV